MLKYLPVRLFDIAKNKNVYSYYRFFKKTPALSKKQIEELQIKKLKSLLLHAQKNVSFYSERFKTHHFSPEKVDSISNLQYLPPLTREDLKENHEQIIAENYQRENLSMGSSSGSTGQPVVYYKDNKGSSAGQAANLMAWEMTGWKFGMKGLHIWGNPTTVNNEWKTTGSKLKAMLYRQHKFPAYKLTEEGKFKELVETIKNGKYEFIDGYTNAIFLTASYIRDNNIDFPELKFVFPTGENLDENQKEIIEQYIGKVYDSYGCSEINGISMECPYCGHYHNLDPHVVVEYGEIAADEFNTRPLIITDLDNYAFPLIRYENGDLGQMSDQEKIEGCNIPFSRMRKVMGRQSDLIKLPGGGTFSVPSFFGSMLLKKLPSIKQYQVVREQKDKLTIKIVLNRALSDKEKELLYDSLEEYLKGKIQYEVTFVDHIPVSRNGKFKLLIDQT